jgi:hypothetical protein
MIHATELLATELLATELLATASNLDTCAGRSIERGLATGWRYVSANP